MINREDMLELTRRMTLSRTSFTRIAGCYVDAEGEYDGSFNTNFLKLSSQERKKHLEIAKVIPFSETNVQLKKFQFNREARRAGSMWQLLLGLRQCGLKNDALMEDVYKRQGLDCSNGSASAIAKSVYDALGAKTYVINNEPDGTNINTNCGSTHIEVLQQFVKEKKLDIAFAYDGDADRCIAVDENGNVVDGDLILYVCGKYLKEQGRLNGDTIVTTIMSNLGLYKACDKAGIRYEKTAVGDKYVYENMLQNNYSLGGEQSGHIIFSKYATTGDGILTSLLLMEVVMEKKQSLGKLVEEVKIYPQLLKNVRVADKKEARENPAVVKAVEEVAETLGDDGRILVRESGTEPVIRVMVEAATDELCKECVDKVIDVMAEEGLVLS